MARLTSSSGKYGERRLHRPLRLAPACRRRWCRRCRSVAADVAQQPRDVGRRPRASPRPDTGQPSAQEIAPRTRMPAASAAAATGAEALDRLGDRAVDVPLRKRLARRAEDHDLVGLRRQRAPRSPSCWAPAPSRRRPAGARCGPSPRQRRPSAAPIWARRTTSPRWWRSRRRRGGRSSSILTSVGTVSFSFCRPSRGPTSTMWTCRRERMVLACHAFNSLGCGRRRPPTG